MAAFPQIFSFFPLSFSVLILFLFHRMIRSATLSGRPFPLSSTMSGRRGVLLWVGPLAQCIHIGMGSLVNYPHRKFLFFYFFQKKSGELITSRFFFSFNFYLFMILTSFFIFKNKNKLIKLGIFLREFHQNKTPISFWCRRRLNLRSLI